MTNKSFLPMALWLASMAVACADRTAPTGPVVPPPPSPPDTRVASLSLDVSSLALDESATRLLVATPRNAAGSPIAGIGVTWSSADAAVATIANGLVKAIRAGTTTVTATAHGQTAQAVVTVSATYDFELIYTVRTSDPFREIYRVDLSAPYAPAWRLFSPQQWASQPQPSPDGSRVAYVCPNPIIGDPSICVAKRDGRDARLVGAFIGESFEEPAWSPDGTQIAFVRTKNDGVADRSHIWVMNADGTGQRPLTETVAGNQNMPAWSPRNVDGAERIAFVQDLDVQPRLWTMRTDGSDRRPLSTSAATNDIQPAWSPDASRVVFQRTGVMTSADLWVIEVATGQERPLVSLARQQLWPSWSPDGRLVAFVSNHDDGAYQVFTTRADGSALARRTFDTADKASPTWLPRVP